MTYVTDSVTGSTNYELYILIALALILALFVIAVFVMKSKMNQQLQEMKKISEILEKNGLDTAGAAEMSSDMQEPVQQETIGEPEQAKETEQVQAQQDFSWQESMPEAAETVAETIEAVPETADAVPETIQAMPETADAVPETIEAMPETADAMPEAIEAMPSAIEEKTEEMHESVTKETTSVLQSAKEGVFVFNGTETVSQKEETAEQHEEPFEGSFEDSFEESFENVSLDEPLQEKENIVINGSAEAVISQPEQSFVKEQPLFGEFTEPAERVHIQPQPQQEVKQPTPAAPQYAQQTQPQPQQEVKQPAPAAPQYAQQTQPQPQQEVKQPAPAAPQYAQQPQPQQAAKQKMTFDTAKSGRAYNKSEIESIIKS